MDAFDIEAMVRAVLDPLGPGGSRRCLPTLWDLEADRATRAPYAEVAPDAVLLLDGPFLQRPELRPHLETARRLDR